MGYDLKLPSGEQMSLVDAVRLRNGDESITEAWVDVAVVEMMAYVLAGPAKCKAHAWLTWADLPPAAQAVLVGVLARHGSQGNSSVVSESIGDYRVQYSDSALFEGRIPRYLNDGEERALASIAGCGGGLYSVQTSGIPMFDFSEPEARR